MKKKVILTTSLATILGATLVPLGIHADNVVNNWVAKTPSEIGSLNSDGTYTVQSGDTIWAIGMHFNIQPSVIENLNGVNNPYDLQIGTILKLNVRDNGNKAVLSVDNGKQTSQVTLNSSDKLDPNKAFGEKVTSKEAKEYVSSQQSVGSNMTSSKLNTAKNKVTSQNKAKNSSSLVNININHDNIVKGSSNTNSKMQVSSNVIDMLAYVKAYGGPNNIAPSDLLINGNVIGQGTADSTGQITISGNNVTLTIKETSNTYNINNLIKEYYNSASQKQVINNLIKQGIQNDNALEHSSQNVVNTPQQAIQVAINKYGTDNGNWRWGCMSSYNPKNNTYQYKWNESGNVSNNDPNGYFIVRNYEKNDSKSVDGGLINTYIVYPNGNIVLDSNGTW